jgi:ADP-ribose pyrophosphatase YjhB (NUDIX family)
MKAGEAGVIHLATGLAVEDRRVLLVASSYPNQPRPLWNLPGGRQQPGELLAETVVREVLEETGLRVEVDELAYVSESYDGEQHFLNATFLVRASPFHSAQGDKVGGNAQSFDSAQDDKVGGDAQSFDSAQDDTDGGDHVVGVEWVSISELAERIVVGVVREPLLAYLGGALRQRYAGFHDAGVTIEWPAGSD